MRADEFDFDLPDELIAQEPAARREDSRLLVQDRDTGALRHGRFTDVAEELRQGDLLVLNDARVLPARLRGTKATGGKVEVLLVERVGGDPTQPVWRALVGAARPPKTGDRLALAGGVEAEVLEREREDCTVRLRHGSGDPMAAVETYGEMPLPPYIRREPGDPRRALDRVRYQTVFARHTGAVAAPTAGLHFSAELLSAVEARGVDLAWVTLDVGPGTFLPVRSDRVEDHRMHEEAYDVPEATARAVKSARERGGRIVAVGTTVVRTLESVAEAGRGVRPGRGRTSLFIVPGYSFRVVDALITNFHLPRSTLLMLVCAFGGRDRVLAAYREAVRGGYRFFSYGDAMLSRSA